jgi:hypothetical protein
VNCRRDIVRVYDYLLNFSDLAILVQLLQEMQSPYDK